VEGGLRFDLWGRIMKFVGMGLRVYLFLWAVERGWRRAGLRVAIFIVRWDSVGFRAWECFKQLTINRAETVVGESFVQIGQGWRARLGS
jgi:hypothetical protein